MKYHTLKSGFAEVHITGFHHVSTLHCF